MLDCRVVFDTRVERRDDGLQMMGYEPGSLRTW